jgi:hypothetical protein
VTAVHPLLSLHRDAADGHFPAADCGVVVLQPLPGRLEPSAALTESAVVAAGMEHEEVLAHGVEGFGGILLVRIPQQLEPAFGIELALPT